MTSPNDPPLSRRAARLAEQAAHHEGVEVFARPGEGAEAPDGRRGSAPVSVPSSAPSDIAYRTEVRPRVPHYDDAPPSLVSPTAPPAPVAPAFVPAAPPAYPVQQVRRRDFRPPAEVPAEAPRVEPREAFDAPLEYHTQLTPRPDAAPRSEPPVEPAPVHVIVPPAQGLGALEQTRSRRELRESRAAQTIAEQPAFSVTEAAPAAPAAPVAPTHDDDGVVHATIEPAPVEAAPMEAAPIEPAPVEAALLESAPVAPAAPAAPVVPVSTGSHWSVGIHDADDPFENTFSREVGSTAALNTNALVLPEMPTGSIAGPVAGTGEIIVTGMIDVSRVVSSTGTVPTMHDSPDIDDLFEPGDHEVAAPDSAPVSALKAVSSHTGTHTVMTGKRSTSNVVTTVLVATTVVMAVVAIGLFVVAAVNGLF
ncbi:MAG: hypothetical protein KIT89_05350 [Microcella sp.]|uniref:hypothetical protein n=1 Tax=Microcella sp. TaxID=1913979 RepID=UPI0024CC1DB3|nr:hypothetical protein [Microcella sp.]UYN84601.1 MAG: hypothetical protein KIT89_05350 [Microcella sp.]